MRQLLLLTFFNESNVIMLSVNIVTVRGLFSVIFVDFITSSALTVASCSAWLFERLLSSLNFSFTASSFPTNIATPDPTSCSFFLSSVYTWIVCSLYSLASVILTASAGVANS